MYTILFHINYYQSITKSIYTNTKFCKKKFEQYEDYIY